MRHSTERRGGARKPAAFTLWYQRAGRDDWLGGWAMNISSSGLAALVPPEESPRVGEVVRIVLMTLPAASASDAVPVRLPPTGRVVRLDAHDGMTRRIAIAFESDEASLIPAAGGPAEADCARPDVLSMAASDVAYRPRPATENAAAHV